jgi:hypothetical protein
MKGIVMWQSLLVVFMLVGVFWGSNADAAALAGTKADVGVTAAAVSTSIVCAVVVIQADPDNSVDVFLGTSAAQPIQLGAAFSITMYNVNLSEWFVKTASSTATINWAGRC